MSCGNIHNCYNQFAKKDKNTSMVSFRRYSSVWFPSQFYIYTFFSFFWKFSLKSSLIATMVGNRHGTSRRVASTDYSLLWCILLTKNSTEDCLNYLRKFTCGQSNVDINQHFNKTISSALSLLLGCTKLAPYHKAYVTCATDCFIKIWYVLYVEYLFLFSSSISFLPGIYAGCWP